MVTIAYHFYLDKAVLYQTLPCPGSGIPRAPNCPLWAGPGREVRGPPAGPGPGAALPEVLGGAILA